MTSSLEGEGGGLDTPQKWWRHLVMTWWQGGGGGVWIPPKSDDVIYEQPLIFVLWSSPAADGNTLQILTTILTNIIDFSLWSIQRVSSILHKRGWGWNRNSEREASSSGDGRFRHHGGELDTMVVILKMVLWWWKNGKWKKLHRFAVGVKEVDDMAFLFTD